MGIVLKKIDLLKRIFYYEVGRMRLSSEYLIPITSSKTDPDCICEICGDGEDISQYYLICNPWKLSCMNRGAIISYALHELGHLIHRLPYETFNEKVYSEYSAEMFCVKTMKKRYPVAYKEMLAWMKKRKSMKKLQTLALDHYVAYLNIKDYRRLMDE